MGDTAENAEAEAEVAEDLADTAGLSTAAKKRRRQKLAAERKAALEAEGGTEAAEKLNFSPDSRVAKDEDTATLEKEEQAKEDDGSENGEDDAEGGEAGASKNKKKKKKKKAAAAAAIAAAGTGTGAGGGAAANTPQAGGSDEEFAAWLLEVDRLNPAPASDAAEALKLPRNFMGYSFIGKLRPALVHPRKPPPPGSMVPDYGSHDEGVSIEERNRPKEIPELAGTELETMREACRLGREILDLASRALKPGVTGDFLDRVVYHACCERKCYPSPLNYYKFPKSVCVSPNEVICHGIPDMRPIEEGDIVNLDVSIYYKGFHSDLNETFFVGKCDEDAHRVVRAAYESLHAAVQLIRPGTLYRDLGAVIVGAASKSGCSIVNTYTGHGVGRLFHGPPNVPHYKKNKAVGIMKPGHVFTVEPMVNLGGNGGDRLWPDNWTAVTKDGKLSSQFEHTFLVTQDGVEVLTARRGVPTDGMPAYDPAMFQR